MLLQSFPPHECYTRDTSLVMSYFLEPLFDKSTAQEARFGSRTGKLINTNHIVIVCVPVAPCMCMCVVYVCHCVRAAPQNHTFGEQ